MDSNDLSPPVFYELLRSSDQHAALLDLQSFHPLGAVSSFVVSPCDASSTFCPPF